MGDGSGLARGTRDLRGSKSTEYLLGRDTQ
ncbi:predicted protein [Sclerotinia sclerotiorum 1980 UF-70]|uniref:Uncharacterized protein n=1 Tax=Sclerotinia sclerotiorum (strain ATCC 18683 / 1980 / Ss-1) TaxID=665079 RepID=A7EY70_SCLS1|nr:predicted protein [Sclerotinia sclerotiorum 1980 UF-70]EDN94412.1 predicted protein [Sclerotinia sclerotiorum 1980 UF-70]